MAELSQPSHRLPQPCPGASGQESTPNMANHFRLAAMSFPSEYLENETHRRLTLHHQEFEFFKRLFAFSSGQFIAEVTLPEKLNNSCCV